MLLLQVQIPFLRCLKSASAGPDTVSTVLEAASAGPDTVSAVLEAASAGLDTVSAVLEAASVGQTPFLRYLKAASAVGFCSTQGCFCRSKCPLLWCLKLSVFAAASATANAIPALYLLHLHDVKFLVQTMSSCDLDHFNSRLALDMEAELAGLVGMILAVQLLKETGGRRGTISLGVDNQAAIRATEAFRSQPGHYLMDQFHDDLRRLIPEHDERKLKVRWTPGHVGIPGNEEADTHTKRAARGESSDTRAQPKSL
ncbi:hypothetical protein BDR07DRAFT_1336092, partial [Suillus spraguei]